VHAGGTGILPVAGKSTGKMPVPQQADLGFMDNWFPIQAKQMDKVGRPMIDEFETAMNRAGRAKGYFIGCSNLFL
jgi:hypothetical protein